MKNKSFFLDFEDEEEISVLLIKLKERLPYHELFFKINQHNRFKFSRKKDLQTEDFYGYYKFPIFEAYDMHTQTTFRVIANQSYDFKSKNKPLTGLFDLAEAQEKYFLRSDIDLILFSKEESGELSNVRIPEEHVDFITEQSLCEEEELYQTIFNYEE